MSGDRCLCMSGNIPCHLRYRFQYNGCASVHNSVSDIRWLISGDEMGYFRPLDRFVEKPIKKGGTLSSPAQHAFVLVIF